MTRPLHKPSRRAFSLTELLFALAIIGVLAGLWVAGSRAWRQRAGTAVSTSQLHSLVTANQAYALDHDGAYCPATSADNLTRWHGGRRTLGHEFDSTQGFLSPYLGGHRQIITCPLLKDFHLESFEKGSGGYGYNAQYFGSTPQDAFAGAVAAEFIDAGPAVMFATTALAVGGGIQEYPFTEPYEWVDHRGRPRGALQPSTHFRARGKALIAWSDGSVTAESPNAEAGPNFYGGDNQKWKIGWFGPRPHNGCWNPNSPAAHGQSR